MLLGRKGELVYGQGNLMRREEEEGDCEDETGGRSRMFGRREGERSLAKDGAGHSRLRSRLLVVLLCVDHSVRRLRRRSRRRLAVVVQEVEVRQVKETLA